MEKKPAAIVIDNGSNTYRAGYGGDEAPRFVFPSVVGQPKNTTSSDAYIGDEACAKAGILSLKYPIERGVVTNWDHMEMIWNHTFYKEMHVDPAEHLVLLTEPLMNPKGNREMMIQIMFETFNVPSFSVALQGLLSAYGYSLGHVFAVEIGDGVSQFVPVIGSKVCRKGILKQNFGGSDIDAYLQRLLADREFTGSNCILGSQNKGIIQKIKEKHCYVAFDYDAELQKAKNTSECNVSYTLPGGNEITLNQERFTAPELLFNPRMNGFQIEGIAQNIFSCIKKCDESVQEDLFGRILLSGGGTLFEGLKERVKKEIARLAPPSMKIRIVAPPERKYLVWIGGSTFSCMNGFQQQVITHQDYNDSGPAIVHSKCI